MATPTLRSLKDDPSVKLEAKVLQKRFLSQDNVEDSSTSSSSDEAEDSEDKGKAYTTFKLISKHKAVSGEAWI